MREIIFEKYEAFKNEEEILQNLKFFKTRFYKNLYKKYSASQISLEEKQPILKKINEILKELKK